MLILFLSSGIFRFGSSPRRVLARRFFRDVRFGFNLLTIVLLVPFRRIFYIIVMGDSFALIILFLLRGTFLRGRFRFRLEFMLARVLVPLLLLPIEDGGIRCRWQWFVRGNRSSIST